MQHSDPASGGEGPVFDRWSARLDRCRVWTPPARRTVVVVPHPDDEVLSSGGLISLQRERGVDVVVVAVTDGGAAYDPAGDPELAANRRGEQRSALDVLGAAPSSTFRLGLPDGQVDLHAAELTTRLRRIVRRDDVVVAPWRCDHHPDHVATGTSALAVARERGAEILGSLFWAWHHVAPDACRDVDLVRLPLDATAHRAKQRALSCHRTQLDPAVIDAPILDDALVEPARWLSEFYVRPERA